VSGSCRNNVKGVGRWRVLLLAAVVVLVALLVAGCDSEYAETPFKGAYLGTYVVTGTVTEAGRNELTVSGGVVSSVLNDNPPLPGNGTARVPNAGSAIGQVVMSKYPKAPLWSPNDGGVYVLGREYAVFASTTVTSEGDRETVAWFGFDVDADLPVEPFRDRESYAGIPALEVLTCLAGVHGTSGRSARLDALVADVQREWRGGPPTNCYAGSIRP